MHLRPPPLCPWPHDLRPPGPGELGLWLVNLDQGPAEVSQARSLLSAPERAHADRFAFEADRRRFAVGRAALRTLLGFVLDVWPETVQIAAGPRGKPALAWPAADLHFNLSNSGDLALIGLTRCAPLGVDIELRRALGEVRSLARSVFSPEEQRALEPLEGEAWQAAFYQLWTRKEAYLKAIGEGLYAPLQDFTVTAHHPARFVHLPGDEPSRWTLLHVDPCPGATAAVALRAPPPRVSTHIL